MPTNTVAKTLPIYLENKPTRLTWTTAILVNEVYYGTSIVTWSIKTPVDLIWFNMHGGCGPSAEVDSFNVFKKHLHFWTRSKPTLKVQIFISVVLGCSPQLNEHTQLLVRFMSPWYLLLDIMSWFESNLVKLERWQ